MSDFVKSTSIPGLFVLERPTFADDRGFFREVFHLDELEKAVGQPIHFVQTNHSKSKPGVLRGIHSDPWNKLVYVVSGKAFIAIADVRLDSQTFGKVETFVSDPDHRFALFLPIGMGNSLCAVGNEDVNYVYQVTAYFTKEGHIDIAWNDPLLKINWPVEEPILSGADQKSPTLRELYPEKVK